MKKLKSLPTIVYLFIFYIAGFLGGCCCLLILGNISMVNDFLLKEDFFHKLYNITVNKNIIVMLCLWKRLVVIILLLVMSYSILGKSICLLFTFFSAFSNGFFLESLIIKYGMQGGVIYLAAILPQGILYGIGFALFLISCIQVKKGRKSEMILREERKLHRARIIVALLFIILGCITEGYFNFYQLFIS